MSRRSSQWIVKRFNSKASVRNPTEANNEIFKYNKYTQCCALGYSRRSADCAVGTRSRAATYLAILLGGRKREYEIKERELRQESERRAEKERFLSMLVHELRNPLSVIHLRTSKNSPSGVAVHQAAREMAQIIERVEQSEALEQASPRTLKSNVDLGLLLRELAAEHTAASRILVDAPTQVTAASDRDLLRSIVINLLDNASKYSPDASPIHMALAEHSDDGTEGAQISIVNEVGEAGAPDAARLFTKYYRSPGAHRRPGSGLGLFLIANWAKSLGGTVDYDRDDDAIGNSVVRFSLWLPK